MLGQKVRLGRLALQYPERVVTMANRYTDMGILDVQATLKASVVTRTIDGIRLVLVLY